MKRQNYLKIFLVFAFLVASVNSYAIDASRPDKLVDGLITKVLKQLDQEKIKFKKNPKNVYPVARKVINKTILPYYDLQKMSSYIVGKPWRKANKAQKLSFMREFKNMIIRTYAKSLLDYSDQTMKVLPYRHISSKRNVVVNAKFIPTSGPSVPVYFRLYQSKKRGWRIYDIAVSGASQIKAYQGSLRASIQKDGIDGAIKAMKNKK